MNGSLRRTIFDLTGRAALVTGGSKGLGRAMAIALAQAGADLVLASRHEEELVSTAAELRALGTRVECVVADLAQRLSDWNDANLGTITLPDDVQAYLDEQ